MHVQSWVCFQFWKTSTFFTNVVNVWNKLLNYIKFGKDFFLELQCILPVCNIHFVLWCNMWLWIFIQISFQLKRGIIYYFILCSYKYMEHVNFNQLTMTPSLFNLHENMWQDTDQLALQAVITCTWYYRMLLTVVDTEMFDTHWN
jgi:hypothetical protein